MWILTTFDVIKQSEKVKGVCEKCGNKKIRTVTEIMTHSPFNKNQDGTVRTYQEVRKAVEVNLSKLVSSLKRRFICGTCFRNLPYGISWPPQEETK